MMAVTVTLFVPTSEALLSRRMFQLYHPPEPHLEGEKKCSLYLLWWWLPLPHYSCRLQRLLLSRRMPQLSSPESNLKKKNVFVYCGGGCYYPIIRADLRDFALTPHVPTFSPWTTSGRGKKVFYLFIVVVVATASLLVSTSEAFPLKLLSNPEQHPISIIAVSSQVKKLWASLTGQFNLTNIRLINLKTNKHVKHATERMINVHYYYYYYYYY